MPIDYAILKQSDDGSAVHVAFLIRTPSGDNNAGVSYADIAKANERGVSVIPDFNANHPAQASGLANGVWLERLKWVTYSREGKTLEEKKLRIKEEHAKAVIEFQEKFVRIWENYMVED